VTDAPRLSVVDVPLYERDVRLRMPFRFGVVTLTESPQAFARARIRLADGREGWGMAAEMLAPKWFDKNPALTNEDNVSQLRAALGLARDLYTGDRTPRSAFGLFAAHYHAQLDACAANRSAVEHGEDDPAENVPGTDLCAERRRPAAERPEGVCRRRRTPAHIGCRDRDRGRREGASSGHGTEEPKPAAHAEDLAGFR